MKKLYIFTILGLLGLFAFGQTTVTFTTSGSWTCPAGVTSVTVECWGAGGGGGYGISTKGAAGGGGGGGAYASSVVSVTPGNSYTITIGAGGSGGTSTGTAAIAGEASSFNTTSVIAAGGGAGTGVTSNTSGGAGAGGTVAASTGSTKYAGGAGAAGVNGTASTCGGGGGGAGASTSASGASASLRAGGTGTAPGGSGGSGADNAAGTAGSTYGGGGAGGHRNNTSNAGGAGASGYIRITYTLPAPANDLCANATALPCGTTNLAGTTVNTVSETAGTGCTMSTYGVWYTFTGTGTDNTISVTTTAFDAEMAIMSGTCGSLTNIACKDAALSSGTETYTFTTTLGTTYYVYVGYYGTGTTTGDFTISRSCVSPCAGTPNAGTASISSATGCASTNFTLSATGLTADGGITYQWQSGTSSTGPWTNIAGATNSTLITSATANTWYILVTTCTNSSLTNNTNVVSYSIVGDLCSCGAYPSNYASNVADEDIGNVTVGSLNNTSALGAVAGGAGSIAFRYSNYTGIVGAPNLQQLATINFSLSSLTTGSNYNNGFQIYIDYNQDGDFADAGEQAYSSAASTSGPHTETGSFVVPFSATLGITRMRVVCVETTFPSVNNYAQSTTYSYGEAEDYCVNITAATACTGTPNAGTATISSGSGCAATNFTLSATGLTAAGGITYQWQSGTSSTGPWTNIAGATSSTLTTSATANTWYQLVTTCANGGGTNNTNVVSYTVVGDICSCGAYPAIYASSTVDEDISNVTVGTLNNSSTLGAVAPGAGSIAFRYSNYTGSVAAPDIQQLATTNFSISSLTTGTSYSHGFQIYIDYNQNGVFETTERCYSSAASTSGPHTETGSFVVPLSALTGITRMRVVSQQTTFPTATNYASTAYTWGETEDYCVNITAAPPCSGTPLGGTTTASSTACGHTGAISVTGSTEASGLTYQWYSSPTGGAPWTLIPGATGATYTPSVSGLYYYREIKCTSSGGTANSSSLQYITSAPSNDECVNATPLTVNAGTTCTVVTAGTVQCASASAQTNSCSGTADDDVWFSFVATNASHTISLLNIAGSVTDMYHSVYSGTCGSLTNIKCNDADVSTISGLTIGETYYVRVYTYIGTAGQTTTFNICVSTSNVVSVVGSSTCENAVAFCASNDSPGVTFDITSDAVPAPAGQCTYMENPSWWYMQISQDGDLDMTIASSCGDVDFSCYGPFPNVTCLASDLTNTTPSELFDNAFPEYHSTYNPTSEATTTISEIPLCEIDVLASPSGNLVDFSGSLSATEYLQIRNAVVGEYYIIIIGNWAGCAGTVSFNQTNFGAPGAGAADCNIVTQCNITSITATTTETGSTYTVSGDINFIDPPATGTLKICDGTVCQTFTAPFTSPQAYTLTGLIPDGLQHQLTATFSSTTVNCEKISNYTAPPSTLPVNLLKLYASCQNSTAAVYWQTASETNNDYFLVEKRKGENEFYEIGRIEGAGNSNSLIDYLFIDENLWQGDNYYRLSQVDFDGTTTIYPIITLNCDNYTEVQPTMQAYPNPFVDEVNVVIQNLDEGEFTLEIINELGKVVYQKKCIASNSEFRTLLNLYNLQPAVYNLQCRSQKNVLTIRVIKK
ncbi:MAG: hypothetical protein A2W93_06640 [Bacteroidetes bacterium GWF2_43_63]|nr:MAG: hypothetical protein A2W94_07895 [Bacteroidetes bacterium GWE2_42_42]OFY53297.1 MAG: hypothetical protein A2W93_06640 [Bacteroidetes bacterium GWF2_43_63]HBG71709.1 hypothetical protein [Bacteroidales bacterium]HCB61626.1 hypothetical protein [Bacteroidales bacterium]HCY22838.1 hypothetical protein [Bacteroidales bacterium]